jgi:transposase-like protein
MYLFRAVDREGEILDMLVQRRRDKYAELPLMRKLLKKQGSRQSLLVTDKLPSYGSAFRQLGLTCPLEQGSGENNRAENSHRWCYDVSERCNGSNQLNPLSAYLGQSTAATSLAA